MLFAKAPQKQPVFSRNEMGYIDKNLKNERVVLGVVGINGQTQSNSL